MTRFAGPTIATVAALLLGGCGASRDDAFPQVQRLVSDRLPARIHWQTGGDEDRAVADAVRELLTHELTAADAVQVALLNDPALQAVFAEVGIRQADLVQAGLLSNPVFSGELRFSSAGTAVELSLVQSFLSILQMPLRKRLAELELSAAQSRIAGMVIDRAATVRTAFYDVQAAGQALELRQTVADAAAASADLAQRLHAAGNITDLDLAEERSLAEEAMIDLAAAELEVLDAKERLSLLMGLWGEATQWRAIARLDDVAVDLPAESVESRAVESSLELAELRLEIDLMTQRVRAVRPLLFADGEIGAAAEREADGDWGVGPTLSVPVPLFDRGNPAIAGATAEMQRAHHRYTAAAIAVRSTARVAQARVTSLGAQARYLREVVLPLRQEVTSESQKHFNAMGISGFQLLDAKRREIEAGERYLDLLHDYWVARVQLDQVLAGGTPMMDPVGGDPRSSMSSARNADH